MSWNSQNLRWVKSFVMYKNILILVNFLGTKQNELKNAQMIKYDKWWRFKEKRWKFYLFKKYLLLYIELFILFFEINNV